MVEACDVTQGPGWRDGLNRSIPLELLAANVEKLIEQEAEANKLRVTIEDKCRGRGLETTVSRHNGDVVCAASALFWDSWGDLMSFLKNQGGESFSDRIVQIDGVKKLQQERAIWAVLVGAAQFAQHFDGYHTSPNCVLEFDPSQGFNNDGATGAAGVSAAALRL